MTDTTLTAALKEAYASAPSNVIIYSTLELYHPTFTSPIRVVRDYNDLVVNLESDAPRNPGDLTNATTIANTKVTFVAFNFDFTKPEVSSQGIPQITITLDNVDRSIVANVERALTSTDLVTVIYREYLSTDLNTPQTNPPIIMSIMSITADVFKVTAVAGFPNLMNKKFPTQEYTIAQFPGLQT
jgi:hypothetical protein